MHALQSGYTVNMLCSSQLINYVSCSIQKAHYWYCNSLHLQAIYLAQRVVTQGEKGFTVVVTGGTQTWDMF